MLVDSNSHRIDLIAQSRTLTHSVYDFAYAREQTGIVQDRPAHINAILAELASISDQPCSMSQCPHWNRSVIGRHAAKLIARNERCLRAKICGTNRGEHTRRSSANDNDI